MRLNASMRRWLPWTLLALAVIVTAVVYWPGVTGGWVFDDYPNIVDNAAIHIQPGHATLAAWVNAALSSPASFLHRPLASITFALNWMQGGGDPYPFKVTNIAIHLLNGVLVFFMLRALLRLMGLRWGRFDGDVPAAIGAPPVPSSFRDGSPGMTTLKGRIGSARWLATDPAVDDAAATRLALIVAAAWMLLPINLMAVLYVVQRMESLCQVFVLAGLWAYLHGRWMMLTAADRGRDRRGLALAICGIVFGTLLGLTSKETAVLLPLFAFFVEWIVLRFARVPVGEPWSFGAAAVAEGSHGHSGDARSAGPRVTSQTSLGHSGAARSAEPGIGIPVATDDPKKPIPGSSADEAGAGPGMTNEDVRTDARPAAARASQARAARSAEPGVTPQHSLGHSGAARSAEPGIGDPSVTGDPKKPIPGSSADEAGAGPGMTNEGALRGDGPAPARANHSGAGQATEPGVTAQNSLGHSGAARSAEPGIGVPAATGDPKKPIPGSSADEAGAGPGMTNEGGWHAGEPLPARANPSGAVQATEPGVTAQNPIGHSGAARSAEPGVTPQHSLGHSGAARSAEPGIGDPSATGDPKKSIPGSSADEAGAGPGMTNGDELREGGPSPAPSGRPLPGGRDNSGEPSPGASRHPLPEGERQTGQPIPSGDPLPAGGNGARQDLRLWGVFTVILFIPAILGFLWLLRGVLRPAALAGRDFTLGQRLLTEPRVLVDYLHWTLFPNPEVLSLYHDEVKASTGILSPGTTLGAMLVLAALIVVAVLLRNRRPLVSLGIAWFFGAQLLTATIIPLELVYEQRMYFASIGVLLAVGALLLGLRWRIRLPLLRGFIVGVAVLWFALATNLRAQEWSNPIRLAVAEANRHPESPRAVYEAGRLLLIKSNYQPGPAMDGSEKYLREASRIPGASTLPDQALIMLVDHEHQGDDAAYWASMEHKLANQPTRQEDISALISLTNCYGAGICKFDVADLNRAYQAALSRPFPIARLNGAYADFQRDILHNDKLAIEYLARAVKGAPNESAYRMDLAALYARNGEIDQAQQQIAALKRMNFAGRLNGQIATLERMVADAKAPSS